MTMLTNNPETTSERGAPLKRGSSGYSGPLTAFALPKRWIVSATLVGLITVFAAGYSSGWADLASADTGGTGPVHSFTFLQDEITLDPEGDFKTVTVSLDLLDAAVVAKSVQVTIVHDDSIHAITVPQCTGLYSGAGVGFNRIDSEGATSIVCTGTTAPTDGDGDGFISGDVLQFTLTRAGVSGDATLSLLGTGVWRTDVIENGAFVGTPALGSLSVLNNHMPTANPQDLSVDEDETLLVNLTGDDDNGDSLTFQVETGPSFGSLSGIAPDLTYDPDPDFNGADSFTFTVSDGPLTSVDATVSLTIDPVNDQPSFTPGADQTVLQDDPPQSIENWATGISAGPANESGQLLTFSITGNTNSALFVSGPNVDASGTLTFEPDINQFGISTITVQLADDGDTTNGGVDSISFQFDIEVIETRQISGAAGTVFVDGSIDISQLVPQVSLFDDSDALYGSPVAVSPDGSFVITSVPTGTYTVKVELLGFQTGEQTGLVVNGGDVLMDPIVLVGGFVDANPAEPIPLVDGADLTLILVAFGTGGIVDRIDVSGNVIDMNGDASTTGLDIDIVVNNIGAGKIVTWSSTVP